MKKYKIVVYFLCLISLLACTNEKQQSEEVKEVMIQENSENVKDSSIVAIDSAIIKGKLYQAMFKKDEFFYVLKEQDTIMKKAELSPFFQFEDFDEDGNQDIGFVCTSCSGVNEYYFFDSTKNEFIYLANNKLYQELKKIDKNYYYSYSKAGCADMDWISFLVEIKNFHAIPHARIYGQGCKVKAEPDLETKIEIFNLSKQDSIKGKLYETLPIGLIEKYENHKWGFIKEYWSNNYEKFVK